jgi:hypothetical protein
MDFFNFKITFIKFPNMLSYNRVVATACGLDGCGGSFLAGTKIFLLPLCSYNC